MALKQEILNLYKEPGETPLERIRRFKIEHPEYKDVKMTYAGRLDPMAEGVLIVLAGEAVHRKEEFLYLPKTYEFEVLWGFATDTHDALGKIVKEGEVVGDLYGQIDNVLNHVRKKERQAYPLFSSRPVKGKPLFEWARKGMLKGIFAPERPIRIFSLEKIGHYEISASELHGRVTERIALITGDFRQRDILHGWEEKLNREAIYPISIFHAEVSTGTYIRGLVHEMGERIGSGAIALSIRRAKVGEFKIEDSLK